MTTHIIAKAFTNLEEKGAELRDQIEAKFADLHTAIANGNRKAQETIANELHTLFVTTHSLISAAHDHAKALMPASVVERGEAQSAEDAAARGRKRV